MSSLKPSRIVSVYAIISALWILLSDRLAQLLFSHSVDLFTLVNTFKGWLYVAAVSAILLALLKNYEAQSLRQQATIAQSEERLNLALSAVSDGVWDWHVETGEVFFSESWFTMLGYGPAELPHAYETWTGLIHPEDRDKTEQTIQRHLVSKEPFNMEFRLRTKAGGWIWVLDRGQVIQQDAAGKALRMVGTHMDITERKRAEELRQQIERTISHNLRSPASSAINIARILREDPDLPTETRGALLDLFEQSGRNMLDTLNSSLDIYKIETGQYQVAPEACEVVDLLRDILSTMHRQDEFVEVRSELLFEGRPASPDARCVCLGVPGLLRMAFQNLLLNAFEATPPGETVRVELFKDAVCRVVIRNAGVVPLEIRERFFDKYVTLGKVKGTGLGTYSARAMVRAQGGSISMDTSDERNETVLAVTLPLAG
ncbi:MAG: PAS domain-containing sensor histidine kinase [Proteobacteria bacterium]|nr:PAS domain-containing sensor histidine kinase [Pseudomonadota bacterium]